VGRNRPGNARGGHSTMVNKVEPKDWTTAVNIQAVRDLPPFPTAAELDQDGELEKSHEEDVEKAVSIGNKLRPMLEKVRTDSIR
jgi:hypothetical protein